MDHELLNKKYSKLSSIKISRELIEDMIDAAYPHNYLIKKVTYNAKLQYFFADWKMRNDLLKGNNIEVVKPAEF